MNVAIITGSAGLIGSESVEFFAKQGFSVVGIDNDMRRYFFGDTASTKWMRDYLKEKVKNYIHKTVDIRSQRDIEKIFKEFNHDIKLIIHTAAQPSHDWAAKEPMTDFTINANGTLLLLEMTRQYAPQAVFVFTSTNKVYGDRPNSLPFQELETRWELSKEHIFYEGIDETMSVDHCKHSLFGASKVSADILVQEYGRYFNMKTVSFRGGCLTGPKHSGAELHGFLAYLVKCGIQGKRYTIYGYLGKQVRDHIHSYDLVSAFYEFYKNPRIGEVYNMGGGRRSHCSILEAMQLFEKLTGRKINFDYSPQSREGDHIWYVSGLNKFRTDYPGWKCKYTLEETMVQIIDTLRNRFRNKKSKSEPVVL